MGKKSSGITRDKDASQENSWQVDKWFYGVRIRRRGFLSFEEADDWLNRQIQEIRAIGLHSKRPSRTFEQAAAKHVRDNVDKVSLELEIYLLRLLMPFIGHLELSEINQEHIDAFVGARLKQESSNGGHEKPKEKGKLAAKTLNLAISLANTILARAVDKWRHEKNVPWLDRRIKFELLDLADKQRPPRPITWPEQTALLAALPPHLQQMLLFCVNTGVRDNVVCQLRWSWEVILPEFENVSIFVVPKEYVKGRKKEGVIFCNSVAQAVIDKCRGQHSEFVFAYRRERIKNFSLPTLMPYRPIQTMNNTAWQNARIAAGLDDLHVHDLRHTFATRLKEASVPDSTISDLLWHGSKSITDHYAPPMVTELLNAIEKVARDQGNQNRSLRTLIQQHRLKLAAPTAPINQSKEQPEGGAK